MSARLLSIGTATPGGVIAQDAAADLACRVSGVNGRERALRAIYRRAGVTSRGSVLINPDGHMTMFAPSEITGTDESPTTAARLIVYQQEASTLAHRACVTALGRARMAGSQITHLVTVSCTGFDAPGVDCALVDSLNLPATVRRTHIGFMGCHGAINAMAVAKAYAESDPSARVLVCCVELCSLHFQYTDDAGVAVANALFADGAAAAVVAADQSEKQAPVLRAAQSIIIPETADCMTWRIGDHGFIMTLSSRVPEVLADQVPGWVRGWLPDFGLEINDVRTWAVHPGGPRVVASVAQGLNLNPGAVETSLQVLTNHGNMSSPTVLFIVEQLLRESQDSEALPLVAMAFGPGLTGEALLLTND